MKKFRILFVISSFLIIVLYQNCTPSFEANNPNSQINRLGIDPPPFGGAATDTVAIVGDVVPQYGTNRLKTTEQFKSTLVAVFPQLQGYDLSGVKWIDTFSAKPFDNSNISLEGTNYSFVRKEASALARTIVNIARASFNCPGDIENECVEKYLDLKVSHLFNRDLDPREKSKYMELYSQLMNQTNSRYESLINVVFATLIDPAFLYRFENGILAFDDKNELTDLEYLNKMTYFLVNKPPSNDVLNKVRNGYFKDKTNVESYIESLMNTENFYNNMLRFHAYWFGFKHLLKSNKKADQDALKETSELIKETLITNKDWSYMLNANKAYINDDLAKIYGLPLQGSNNFRWQSFTNNQRIGLLSQYSFLSGAESAGGEVSGDIINDTSTTQRGYHIQKTLLCSAVPPLTEELKMQLGIDIDNDFSPDSNNLSCNQDIVNAKALKAGSSCLGCHRKMDALAYGLDNYNKIGGYRTEDHTNCRVSGQGNLVSDDPISGRVTDWGSFNGPKGFSELIQSTGIIKKCLVRRIVEFDLGEKYEQEKQRGLVTDTYNKYIKNSDQSLKSLLKTYILSDNYKLLRK